MHIAICSIRDIKVGESLSYDYQFDTSEADTFKCACRSANCRGTMAPSKPLERDVLKLTRNDRKKLLQEQRQKERGRSMEELRRAQWELSYTGKLLPGDSLAEVYDLI